MTVPATFHRPDGTLAYPHPLAVPYPLQEYVRLSLDGRLYKLDVDRYIEVPDPVPCFAAGAEPTEVRP